jgi:hypothetical protein
MRLPFSRRAAVYPAARVHDPAQHRRRVVLQGNACAHLPLPSPRLLAAFAHSRALTTGLNLHCLTTVSMTPCRFDNNRRGPAASIKISRCVHSPLREAAVGDSRFVVEPLSPQRSVAPPLNRFASQGLFMTLCQLLASESWPAGSASGGWPAHARSYPREAAGPTPLPDRP